MRSRAKTYTLRLTERQLWTLMECYEASFTEPEGRGETEEQVSKKLSALHQKAWKEKQTALTNKENQNV